MSRGITLVVIASLAFTAPHAIALPTQPHELSEYEVEVDVIGDVDGSNPVPQKAAQNDTTWIADWSFARRTLTVLRRAK